MKALIELAREEQSEALTPQRRERILRGVLERLERDRQRRRLARAFAAGASTVLLAALVLRLVTGLAPWISPSGPELARKAVAQRLVAQ